MRPRKAPINGVRLNGGRLRHETQIRGLTARELAKLAGVSAATVSHAMTGHVVSAPTAKALAKALGATEPSVLLSDLLETEGSASAPAGISRETYG